MTFVRLTVVCDRRVDCKVCDLELNMFRPQRTDRVCLAIILYAVMGLDACVKIEHTVLVCTGTRHSPDWVRGAHVHLI